MSRRSSRLVSGGYYNSDEESDSSSVTNISYRENTVKVFKKKTGTRKTPHRAPTKAIAHASSVGPEPPAAAGRDEGLSPSPPSRQTEHTMRTVAFISTAATPRPPLTQSSGRGQTAARSPPAAAAPEKSSYAGLHLRAKRKELTQSGVDSSGYSSSEGAHRKPPGTGRTGSTSEAPSTGYWDRIRCAVFSLMDSASLMAAALQARIMHLTALAAPPSVSSRLKKACGLLLLLLLLALLCVWLLPPFLTSLVSRWPVAETKPQSGPGLPAATPPPPPPPPQHDAIQPVVDPAVVSAAVEQRLQQLLDPTVSAAVEARMQLVLEEQREQQHALMQMERLQLDVQELKGRLAALDSGDWLRLEQEVTGLGRQMVDYRADTLSAAAVLSLRFQDLEAQNAKLSQEWSSIQLPPPAPAPAPCPDTSSPPAHLTPELQQAMEDWLSARIKEQEAFRLADGGSCSACGRPIADQMADFALETQGASVVSTRCSETFRTRSACVTLFGFPLWYPSESPRTVIQGYPVLLPGKCWAFHGVQGTLVISLSHPVSLTHVTLDHLPRFNSPTGHIDSAPKDFEVYGLKDETEEGTLLGTFTYDEHGASTQTFRLPDPGGVVYRCVELRVLSNWGHVEYTCLYRFRVHGEIAASQ